MITNETIFLVVDDADTMRKINTSQLELLGGRKFLLANNGMEALAILRSRRVNVIISDCNMPVMDGYEASRQIRRSGRWPDLPIVALTANAMSEERERCRAAGMNDYLAKPFRREELKALLDLWVPTTTSL